MANSNRAATRRVQHVAQMAFSAFSLILQHVLRCHVIAVLASIFICTGIAHAAGANYVYDELGRLVQMIAGDGSSTQYAYDAAGNVTAVKADTVNTLAISSFTPTSGDAGTNVTVFGSGFSTTAASNTVTINNVAATVTSASASQLNLTVPASATTGLITVSNANGSVTSTQAFTVGSTLSAPTITSFTPTIGAAGTAVTINGTNFQAGVSNNKAFFGGVGGVVTSLTAPGQAIATVPSSAQSGKISLQTAAGTGTSSADFFVVPSGIAVADVVTTGRIVADGVAATPTINTAGKYAMLLFDGTAGQQLSLGMSSFTPAPGGSGTLSIRLYGPTGNVVSSCSLSGVDKCQFAALPQSATYRILLGIDGSHTASMSLLLSSAASGSLVPNAAATTFATTRTGQTARYTFSANTGDNYSLAWTGATFNGYWSYLYVYAPDGSQIAAPNFSAASSATGEIQLNNLSQTGSYTVSIVPYAGGTGQVGLQLLSPAQGALTVDGAALSLNQVAGATGRYTFNGTVGQRLGLGGSGVTFTPAGDSANWSVIAPNGTTLVNCGGFSASNGCVLPQLTAAGVYTVVVVPSTGTSAIQGTLTLSSEVSGTLTANAAATIFTTARAGQNARYTFNATAGDNYTLAWTGSTFSGNWSTLIVAAPDGSQVSSQYFGANYMPTGEVQLNNLSQTGSYTVFMAPSAGAVGQVAIQLLSPATGALTIDGAPLAINQAAGATGRYTFNGTAGQHLGLGMTSVTVTPAGGYYAWSVTTPTGATLATCTGFSADSGCALPALPATGVYTVLLAPSSAISAVQGNMTLLSEVSGTLTANAAPTLFTARVGQNGRYTFNAAAGDNYTLAWTGATFGTYYNTLSVYAPDGSQVTYNFFSGYAPTGILPLNNLAQTGTYTVIVAPDTGRAGQVALQLLSPESGSLIIDGTPLAINQTAGMSGRYTFNGTVGQRLGLGVSGTSFTPSGGYTSWLAISPNGTTLKDCGNFSTDSACVLPALPTAGRYTVLVQTNATTAVQGSLLLSSEVAGLLTANAAATTFTAARPGQNARYTFNATSGDNYTLAWTGNTLGGTSSNLSVYAPNGAQIASTYYFGAASGASGELQLANLAETGTYAVTITPYGGVTGQVAVQLLSPAAGVLNADGAALTINQVAGSIGKYTFSGSIGQRLGLAISNATLTPAGGYISWSVIGPNGATLKDCGTFTTDSGCVLPQLNATGVYTVVMTASNATIALQGNLTLSNELGGTLTANAAASSFTTARPGQNARYTFSAASGDNYSLVWTGATFAGSANTLYVYAPDGSQIATSNFGVANGPAGEIQLTNLSQTGVYSIFIVPNGGVTGQMTIQLLAPATGDITIDSTALAINQVPGGVGRYTFIGTTGQRLGLGISGVVFTPTAGASLTITLLDPENRAIFTCGGFTANASCNLPALPADGTYTMVLTLGPTTAVKANLILSTEITGTLVVNAPAQASLFTRVGQNGRYTFDATAGQNLSVNVSGSTFATSSNGATVYAPDGTAIGSTTFGNTVNGTVTLTNVSQTGAYTIFVDPYQADIGQLSVGVVLTGTTPATPGTSDGVLMVDGDPLTVTLADSQVGVYTFSGIVGQSLGLGFSGIASNIQNSYEVYKPDGSLLLSDYWRQGNGGDKIPLLPMTGTYKVAAKAHGGVPINITLTLSSDVVGSLASNTAPVTLTTTRNGQNGRYTFNATAGANYDLVWANATYKGYWSTLTVFAPDGTQIGYANFSSDSNQTGDILLNNLTQTGTYTVAVVPNAGGVGAVALQLLLPAAGSLTVDGPPLAISLAAGASGQYTFSGVVGQRLGLALSGLSTTPAGGSVTWSVIAPNGSTMAACGSINTDNGCVLPKLPATGSYTIAISPNGTPATVQATLTLSSEVTGALTANAAATTMQTTRVGQNGRYTFTANAGDNYSLVWTGATFNGNWSTFYLYAPDGSQMTTQSFSASYSAGEIPLSNLSQTGTYTLFAVPYAGGTGQVALQLLSPATGSLTVDGPPLTINQAAGENGQYTFNGTIGQQLGLGISGVSFPPSGSSANWSVIGPNGGVVSTCGYGYFSSDSSCGLPQLYANGIYTVVITQTNATAATKATLTLSSNVSGTLKANAAATTFTTARVGQNGRYTFSANAGDNYSLAWNGATFNGYWSNIYVYAPDGSQIASSNFSAYSNSSGEIQLNSLPQVGAYTVLIVPASGGTGQVTLQLLSPASGALTINGTPLAISQVAGATGRYTFNGMAGQQLGLGISGTTITPASSSLNWSIIAPNGTTLITCSGGLGADGGCALPRLPVTGTYTVMLIPNTGTTAIQGTLSLSSEVTGTLSANAAASTIVTARSGQNARYTFSAATGDSYSLTWTGETYKGAWTYLYVYAPDGSQIASTYTSSDYNPSGGIQLNNLPQAGTYTVFAVPYAGQIGQIALQLLSPVTAPLTVDGTPLAINQMPGANGKYTFNGTIGQRIGLGISGVKFTPGGGYVNWTVIAPNGSLLKDCNSFSTDSGCVLPQLNATGVYTVVLIPSNVTTAIQGTLSLSTEVAGTLTANAAATAFATARAGQNGRYTFTANAGDNYNLTWAGSTFHGTWSYLYVYAPDGSQVAGPYFDDVNQPSGIVALHNLSQTGTYTVFIVPYAGGVGQVALQLLSPATGALTVDGTPLTINLVAGQSGSYSFSGTVGQYLKVALSGITVTPVNASVTVSVIGPSGAAVGSPVGAAGAVNWNVPEVSSGSTGLPSTGTYTVIINPNSAGTAFSGALSINQFGLTP